MESGYRSILNLSSVTASTVPNYWPWVASHLRLPHHDSALNRGAYIPRGCPRVVRVTEQHAQNKVESNTRASFKRAQSVYISERARGVLHQLEIVDVLKEMSPCSSVHWASVFEASKK
jgi:hypothetical protein